MLPGILLPHLAIRPRGRRCAASARPVARVRQAATWPQHHREYRGTAVASCSASGSGRDILTAQTCTPIGAGLGSLHKAVIVGLLSVASPLDRGNRVP